MRLFLTALLTLLIFTANQAAQAFEQCEDPSCLMMDVQKKAEHQKKDPACAAHCAVNGHHLVTMPESLASVSPLMDDASVHWSVALMPESIIPEGLIEPPSLA